MNLTNKKDIRILYKTIRKEIDNKDVKSSIIVSKIKELDIYKNSKNIALYKAFNDEVNIDELIIDSINCGKNVYLPRVLDKENIEFYKIESLDDLNHLSHYGIIEPSKSIKAETIDLFIVPGLVFDLLGYRIGYGNGYYDRYLSNHKGFKIGVTYSECLIDEIDTSEFDINVDLIITDK